jgi:nucleoside 2-deoxyribosyltransferase
MNGYRIYLASPLFSLNERQYISRLASYLTKRMPGVSFILPHAYAKSLEGRDGFEEKVFDYCLGSVRDCDAVLCILDGPDVDSGTCVEMGFAYALGKPIVGIRTDFRSSEEGGVNLMVRRVCRELIWLPSADVTMRRLVREVASALDRVHGPDAGNREHRPPRIA